MLKFFLVPFLLVMSTISYSQKTILSIGPELAFPGSSYSMSTNAGTGFGGSVRIESTWRKHISGMLTVGYLGFAEKELPFSGTPPTRTKVKAIPIQAGVKYYIQKINEPPKGFFISAELGLMPTSTHFDYAVNPDFDFKESGLSTALGIGYLAGIIEAGFRLQYNLTASGFDVYYYNFRLAYCFLKIKNKK